jgi:WD40 repeat protein
LSIQLREQSEIEKVAESTDVKTRHKKNLGGDGVIYRFVAFSPDNLLLASHYNEAMIKLWDVKTGYKKAVLECHSYIGSLAFSPDSKMLASSHADGTILIWDMPASKLKD